jgi:hypothetical protein
MKNLFSFAKHYVLHSLETKRLEEWIAFKLKIYNNSNTTRISLLIIEGPKVCIIMQQNHGCSINCSHAISDNLWMKITGLSEKQIVINNVVFFITGSL